MAAASKVSFRPSCDVRCSRFACAPRSIFSLTEYEQAGILTCKSDPLNPYVSGTAFMDDVRGLSHAEIIRAAVAAKRTF